MMAGGAGGEQSRVLEELLRRASAGQLACPYCQEALAATRPAPAAVQLRCPNCGFLEQPDVLLKTAETEPAEH